VLFNSNYERSILSVTAMNRLTCFMLFYYQLVTCLLVTCAAADVGLHVDATACFPVHLKLNTVNRDRPTVWGGVSSGKGTRLGAQNRQKLPILDPKILSLKHPDF